MDSSSSNGKLPQAMNVPQPLALPPQEVILNSPQPMVRVQNSGAFGKIALAPAIPTLDSLFKAFRQRWLLALLVGSCLGVGGGVGNWYLRPPQYTAHATLEVSPTEHHLLSPEQGIASNSSEIYQRTQAALVKSRRVLAKALGQDHISKLQMVRIRPDPLSWLEEELKAGFLEGTYLLRISLSGDEPKELADIVNAVKDAYLTEVANAERTQRLKQLDDLENAYKQAEKTLKGKRDLLQMLAENLPASDSREAAHMQSLELDKLHALYMRGAKIEGELGDAELLLEVKQPSSDGKGKEEEIPAELIDERLDQHPALEGLRKKLVELEALAARSRAVTVHGRASPELERELHQAQTILKEQKEKLRSAVATKLRRELAGKTVSHLVELRDKVRILRRQLADIKTKVKEQETVVQGVGKSSIGLELKRDEIKDADAILKLVRDRKERLQMELMSTIQRISEHDNAAVPTIKNTRSQLLRAGMMGFWFFLLGSLGISYWEYRIGRISGREDVSQRLQLPVFGTLPVLSTAFSIPGLRDRAARARSLGLLLRECIDGIRTTLLRHEATESRRVFLVTSPGSQEGKTTLSIHLATSIARAHRKTLLIDCDLRNPSIHQLLALPVAPGLNHVLKEEIDLAEAIQPTQVEGLFILSPGEADVEGINALSHRGIEKLFAQLRQQFDYIIIDSSPILPVVDALLVGVHVDGVILSIRPRVSHLPRLHEALERLTAARIPVLGGVVNGVSHSLYCPKYHYPVPQQQLARQA